LGRVATVAILSGWDVLRRPRRVIRTDGKGSSRRALNVVLVNFASSV